MTKPYYGPYDWEKQTEEIAQSLVGQRVTVLSADRFGVVVLREDGKKIVINGDWDGVNVAYLSITEEK